MDPALARRNLRKLRKEQSQIDRSKSRLTLRELQLRLALLQDRAARMPARSFFYLDEDAYFFRLISTPGSDSPLD